MANTKSHRVAEVYGDQVCVDGQWFHAERIFGRPAASFSVGDLVESLARSAPPLTARNAEPDELVSCSLYRGCSSNEMDPAKVEAFSAVMIDASGWGAFPLVSGYVETVSRQDVSQCEQLLAEGRVHVWTSELGWSRLVTAQDLGARYVHLDNGHHRLAAACLASNHVGPIMAPVADRHVEEASAQFTPARARSLA